MSKKRRDEKPELGDEFFITLEFFTFSFHDGLHGKRLTNQNKSPRLSSSSSDEDNAPLLRRFDPRRAPEKVRG